MKTLREILLKRHQAVEPKLDAIRNNIVREGRRAAVPEFRVIGTVTLPVSIWRELIFPCRRIWAGLAAVWIVILTVNFSMRDHSPTVATKSAPTAEMIMAWRQQERLLAELIGPDETRTAAPPKPFAPQPRSEQRFEIMAV